jgi:hypothetical protein
MTDREYNFFDMIKRHDYFFIYADDQLSYKKGQESRKKIYMHIENFPNDEWIWKRYCQSVDRGTWPSALEELRDD